jgi:hypothetical protein
MARNLEDIFNECYERIRSGESLESCLRRYPKHAAELESLLSTAFDIGRRASYIQPRPEFKHWALVRLEGEQHYLNQQRQPAKTGHFGWRQSWSVAITVVLILLLAGSGTVIASSNAMPDEPLYPVKLATEEVRVTFAATDAQKVQIHTQLAETRAMEIETMAKEGKTEHAAITAARLVKQLELASAAIDKLETTPTETLTTTPPPQTTVTPPVPPAEEEQPPITATQPPAEEEQPPSTATQPPAEEEQPPTTATQPPAEEEQPPTTATTDNVTTPPTEEEQPPSTATQPPAEEEQPPSRPTTDNTNVTISKFERFKRSLDKSTSKSLEALDNAQEKASPQTKKDWQRAIDTIWERGRERQSDKEGTWNWGDWNKPTTVWPSQPAPQSANITNNQWQPNPVNSSQNQPSSIWQRNR